MKLWDPTLMEEWGARVERLRRLPIEDLELKDKWNRLISLLESMESVVVAFSGGVDSSLLLYTSHMILGDGVVAVIARSPTYPVREVEEARMFTLNLGVRSMIIESEEMGIEEFRKNPPERCYYCKYELFHKLDEIKRRVKAECVIEGSNRDDVHDYRPGLKAVEEWGVRSPLKEVGLGKEEVRRLSRILGLPTWSKPSLACLSSRLPYGERITPKKLKMIEEAENVLWDHDFTQVRVRYHGGIARIEVNPDELKKFFNEKTRRLVVSALKRIGFTYVTLDLEGYRTGSMNEAL